MATPLKRGTARGRGAVSEFDLDTPKTARSRLPEIALGLLIIAVFGLASPR